MVMCVSEEKGASGREVDWSKVCSVKAVESQTTERGRENPAVCGFHRS